MLGGGGGGGKRGRQESGGVQTIGGPRDGDAIHSVCPTASTR